MERIITRNGDYLYTKEDLIDFLDAAGIDRYDCDAIGRIFNSEENVQAAKDEIDSDLRRYEASLEHNRNIAEEIIWAIEEKLKMQRITGAREFLKDISEKLEDIYYEGIMKRERLYECLFHCGDQPTQEILFWSCKRKGSKTNEEDAYRAIARKYGIRTRKYAVIDAIWRCTEDDY